MGDDDGNFPPVRRGAVGVDMHYAPLVSDFVWLKTIEICHCTGGVKCIVGNIARTLDSEDSGPFWRLSSLFPKEASPQVLDSDPLHSGLLRLGRPLSCGPVGLVHGLDRARLQLPRPRNCTQTARVVQKRVRRRDKRVTRTLPPPLPRPTTRLPNSIIAVPVTALDDTIDGLNSTSDGRVSIAASSWGGDLLLPLRTSLFALRVPGFRRVHQ
ncbi:hypothetical protein BC826DRAFT_1120191 [Russula brevipes]|nr:hypothetical protein BC826DRAFT_1120191 [Russula brevipes]